MTAAKDLNTTGTTLLRDALRARKKSSAIIARDLMIPSDHMSNFIEGHRTLPPDTLCKLATYLFNGAVEYVPAVDKLRSANRAPTMTMAVYPPRWQASEYTPPNHPQRGPKPVKPAKQQPTTRPGWVA